MGKHLPPFMALLDTLRYNGLALRRREMRIKSEKWAIGEGETTDSVVAIGSGGKNSAVYRCTYPSVTELLSTPST